MNQGKCFICKTPIKEHRTLILCDECRNWMPKETLDYIDQDYINQRDQEYSNQREHDDQYRISANL